MRGIIHPEVQYPADPLKTEVSRSAVPIPHDLALTLSAHVDEFSTDWIMAEERGAQMGPWQLQREIRRVRPEVNDLPAGFRFHDYADLRVMPTSAPICCSAWRSDCYGSA
jgi:hypothetical protein